MARFRKAFCSRGWLRVTLCQTQGAGENKRLLALLRNMSEEARAKVHEMSASANIFSDLAKSYVLHHLVASQDTAGALSHTSLCVSFVAGTQDRT